MVILRFGWRAMRQSYHLIHRGGALLREKWPSWRSLKSTRLKLCDDFLGCSTTGCSYGSCSNRHEVPSYYGSRVKNATKGVTKWIDTLWEESNMPAYNKLVRIHCKAGSMSVRLVFETRAKCQDFIARYKMMVSPMQLTVPSAAPIQISFFVNPIQLKTERLENNLRRWGENWLTN